jgi:hypothetical protein
LAAVRDEDQELLMTAAWLHDVGYSPDVAVTGFHPLDGALYLKEAGAPRRLVGLVAFHSSAAAEAELCGLSDEIGQFADERTLTRDLLWYCDMTTGPDGRSMSFNERMAEVRERYPADHYVTRALDVGMGERRSAIARVETWMAEVGIEPQV